MQATPLELLGARVAVQGGGEERGEEGQGRLMRFVLTRPQGGEHGGVA
eukprot:CAMPEP_0114130294 /NCGR_PEP_ID=MMETSP0043_2-20121206/11943_1 /TAXON_ID=464988 /ORGANISM="Hemiselmis andersenii, Strain CCMP644" /LENGTH=47 /DNA_ID= /DNA_START= /DNA_END= /DNA_ORIENTATION=